MDFNELRLKVGLYEAKTQRYLRSGEKCTETHSFNGCVNYMQYRIKSGCSKFLP